MDKIKEETNQMEEIKENQKKKKTSAILDFRSLVALFILAIVIINAAFIYSAANLLNSKGSNIVKNVERKHNNATREVARVKVVEEESQVIEVVKNSSQAVVSIVATAEVPYFEKYYDDSMYPEGFGDFFGFFKRPMLRQKGTEKKRVGAGTGFIVSSDGYIMTNKHVVESEDMEYTVILNDEKNRGEKVKAKVVARDPNNDIAVLKIEKQNLPYLKFGDSKNLKVGQTAIAIGYALGEFENTVSKGVVSGLSRSVEAVGNYHAIEYLHDLIQTDAAINPGNSGGPLLDIEGNIIGMNVAMADAQSIGFAIPVEFVKSAYNQVRETGTIKEEKKAFLGIRYIMVTEKIKSENKLPYNYGALIMRGKNFEDLAVIPGSPADKSGLVENDIILEVDGEKVTEENQLSDIIRKHKPGDEIKLKVYHKGEEKMIDVKL